MSRAMKGWPMAGAVATPQQASWRRRATAPAALPRVLFQASTELAPGRQFIMLPNEESSAIEKREGQAAALLSLSLLTFHGKMVSFYHFTTKVVRLKFQLPENRQRGWDGHLGLSLLCAVLYN